MKVESVYRHLQLGEVSKIDLSVETQWIEEWARLSGLYVVFLHVDARLQNAQMIIGEEANLWISKSDCHVLNLAYEFFVRQKRERFIENQ